MEFWSPHRTLVEHMGEMRDRMATLWPLVREHMLEAQTRVYNRGAQRRDFQPGDKVLVLVPTSEYTFLARWNGPYEVIEKATTETEPAEVTMEEQLSQVKKQELRELVGRKQDVFSSEPGHTDLAQHHHRTQEKGEVETLPHTGSKERGCQDRGKNDVGS
ncbi:uncharacterized protein [Salvelinus sp. IW2-2015]|uniref:uncharacterized protein isoform X5 n=1 Tax=Salvelinus sp. IW2-2015 TaxID=2691554 RepID=UPI000CDFD35B|nr:uncharacterized protein LOC111973647 isoform X4 [Salvelinus alpinus]